jgi:hypothetical protein
LRRWGCVGTRDLHTLFHRWDCVGFFYLGGAGDVLALCRSSLECEGIIGRLTSLQMRSVLNGEVPVFVC